MTAECCPREGTWRFCPWCGAAWDVAERDRRRETLSIQAIARMRRQGITWKDIGASYGYPSGQTISGFAREAYRRWYMTTYPRPTLPPHLNKPFRDRTSEELDEVWDIERPWETPLYDAQAFSVWLMKQADG